MGFRVNPDRWMPMGDYIRLVIYFLTHDDEPSPYDRFYKSKWDKRLSNVKTLDGPIHTLWVWKTRIQCNWFVIGLRCQIKGHEYRKQRIVSTADYEWEKVGAGRSKRVLTGKRRMYRVSVCAYCGNYRGMSWDVIENA